MVCFLGNNDSKQASEIKDSELEILRIEMEPSTEELGKKLSLLKAGTVSEFCRFYGFSCTVIIIIIILLP